MIGAITQVRTESDNGHSENPHAARGTLQKNEPEHGTSLTFAQWLRSLECPQVLDLEAQDRKFLLVRKWKAVLSLWQSLGYPEPGEWPSVNAEADPLEVAYYRLTQVIILHNAQLIPQLSIGLSQSLRPAPELP